MFILSRHCEHTVWRRDWYREKVGSGESSGIFPFVLGRGTGDIKCIGMFVQGQIWMSEVSVS